MTFALAAGRDGVEWGNLYQLSDSPVAQSVWLALERSHEGVSGTALTPPAPPATLPHAR